MLLHNYWSRAGYFRSAVDLFVVGPSGNYVAEVGNVDSCSDWVVFDAGVAGRLGLQPPFPRVIPVSGVAGAIADEFTLPPDGTVSLFLTDYSAWCYLPSLPVGFWPPVAPGEPTRRNILGFTGFQQHFEILFRNYLPRPEILLIEAPSFPGSFGRMPPRPSIARMIRRLKGLP
jgi:hypothetical protein